MGLGISSMGSPIVLEGADPTGTNDCTALLTNAIKMASAAGGGTIYVPPGLYLLTNGITIDSDNISLVGAGSPMTEVAKGTVFKSSVSSAPIIKWQNSGGCSMRNITVQGGGQSGQYGIQIASTANMEIMSCAVISTGSYGLYFSGNTDRTRLYNVFVSNSSSNAVYVSSGCSNNYFYGLVISSGYAGAALTAEGTYNDFFGTRISTSQGGADGRCLTVSGSSNKFYGLYCTGYTSTYKDTVSGSYNVLEYAFAENLPTIAAGKNIYIGAIRTASSVPNLVGVVTPRLHANGTALQTSDFGTLTNWGSSPSVSAVSGYDMAGTVTIASGTSPSGVPSFVLTFKDGTFVTEPIIKAWLQDTDDAASQYDHAVVVDASALTSATFTWKNTTAAASKSYKFGWQVIGK